MVNLLSETKGELCGSGQHFVQVLTLCPGKGENAVIRERRDAVADVVDNLVGHIPSAGDPSHRATACAHDLERGLSARAFGSGEKLKQASRDRLSS